MKKSKKMVYTKFRIVLTWGGLGCNEGDRTKEGQTEAFVANGSWSISQAIEIHLDVIFSCFLLYVFFSAYSIYNNKI